jgi:hypothetical protein
MVGRKIFLIFALVAIAALIGLNVYLSRNRETPQESSQTVPQKIPQIYPETQLIISPVEASEPILKDSPDGKLTLLAKTVKSKNEVTYTFTVTGKEIFVKTVNPSVAISIPYNTWSPNGKYIFLKENSTKGVRFFVLSTSAASSDQNDQTADITDLFAKKYPDLTIGDVTGWGGVNLVVLNSIKGDGGRGPSFWFEMPTHSFTQLSMRF